MNQTHRPTSKVLLIGWEAAEWNIIEPLLDACEMPYLNRLLGKGVMGRMMTLDPPLAPLSWTSVVTGKRPEDHGVIGFEEPAENGVDVRPFSSESRRTKAIWNILSEAGMACHVIGWPATHPAESLSGVILSPLWDAPVGDRDAMWDLAQDSVTPASFVETAAELRMHPGEMSVNDLRSFIPSIREIDPRNEPALLRLGQAIAVAASRQTAATYLMENEQWDFLAVYLPSLGEVARSRMHFAFARQCSTNRAIPDVEP